MASLFKGRTVAQGAEDLAQGAEDLAVTAAVEDNDEVGGMAATRPAAIARSSGAAGMQWRNGGPAAPQGGARGRRRGAASRPAVCEWCSSEARGAEEEQRRPRYREQWAASEASSGAARRSRQARRTEQRAAGGERSREQPAATITVNREHDRGDGPRENRCVF
jgi:hypothetical protein